MTAWGGDSRKRKKQNYLKIIQEIRFTEFGDEMNKGEGDKNNSYVSGLHH